MSYRLSICIPTYNRVTRLQPLLKQICGWVECRTGADQVEICISDNGSDDGTWPLLQQFGKRHAFLSIRRSEENQGFGRNFWAAANLAQGEYIYFSGDDDLFQDGAIDILLAKIESGADLILMNSHPTSGFCEKDFTPGETVALDSLESYLAKVGVFHGSFIGNLLFKHKVFSRHCNIGDAVFLSAYPHLFPVLRALRDGRCLFANQPITNPDDSVRGWRKMQPIYTAVDVARITREEILPHIGKKPGRLVMRQLGRSLPRAALRQWKKDVVLDPTNPYQSLRLNNLRGIYL